MNWGLVAISGVIVAALIVFGCTKKLGFGPYNTSTFLLLVVTGLTAILAVVGKIDHPDAAAILLAIIGFAGGLFAGGRGKERDQSDDDAAAARSGRGGEPPRKVL